MDDASKHLVLIEDPSDPDTEHRMLLREVVEVLEVPPHRILRSIAAPKSVSDADFAKSLLQGYDVSQLETIDIVGHGVSGQLNVGRSMVEASPEVGQRLVKEKHKLSLLTLDADESKRDDLSWLRELVDIVRPKSPGVVLRLLGCDVGGPPLVTKGPESVNHRDGAVLLHFLASYLRIPVEAPLQTLTTGDYRNGYFALEAGLEPRRMRKCIVDAATRQVDFTTASRIPTEKQEQAMPQPFPAYDLAVEGTSDLVAPVSPYSPSRGTFLRHALTLRSLWTLFGRWLGHAGSVLRREQGRRATMTARTGSQPSRPQSSVAITSPWSNSGRTSRPDPLPVTRVISEQSVADHLSTDPDLPTVTGTEMVASAVVRYPGHQGSAVASPEQLAQVETFFSGTPRVFTSPPLYARDATIEVGRRELSIVGRCSYLVVHDKDANTWAVHGSDAQTREPIYALLEAWGYQPLWLAERRRAREDAERLSGALEELKQLGPNSPTE